MTIKYLDSKRIVTSAEGTYGSGGGSGGAVTSGNPTGTAGQGNSGGYGTGSNGNGGGGGGSSSAGTNGSLSSGVGSDGGSGTNNNWTTGSNVGYAGGGAGGHANNSGGSGTATHGAHAGAYPNNVADANTGAGGSAGDSLTENSQVYGGTGGSGIVVVRYLTSGAPTVVSSVTSSTVGSYTVHRFISTGSFQITSGSTSADILVVGGGGSGGTRRHGAGGGAGGYIETLNKSLGVDTYTITIGAGGASTQSTNNASGSNGTYSAFDDGGGNEIKAKGGGFGGGYNDAGGGGTSPATKPTNVQDNSILVEKDTSKRYWFNIPDFDLSELKAYYKFDETTGNILNKSTSIGSTVAVASSDLVVTGATRGVTGKLDKALSFDGSGDYVQATSAGYTGFNFMHQNGATFTVLSWYKVDAFTAGTNLIGTEQVSGSESGFLFALRHDDRKWDIFIGQTNSDLIDFSNSVQTPNDTDWHMLMVQYNDATGTVSVSIDNGTVATSTGHNLTNTSNQTNYFIMGADGALNGSWNGDIDETSIWNRVLTTAEITTIYNSGTGKTLDTAKGVGKWTYEYALPTISGLKLHLDASDASTITKDGSNLVSAWNDKSGEGNHISQSTGSKQPLWVDNTQNGLPLIRFDGSNDQLNRSTFVNGAISQGFYMFVVMKPTSGSASSPYNFDGGSGARGWCYTASGNTVRYGAGIEQVVDPNLPSTPAMYTFFIDGNSSDVRKNSVSTASGTFGSSTINGLWLACRHSDASFGSPDHAEILFYDNDIGTTNRDAVEAYLKKKWGL